MVLTAFVVIKSAHKIFCLINGTKLLEPKPSREKLLPSTCEHYIKKVASMLWELWRQGGIISTTGSMYCIYITCPSGESAYKLLVSRYSIKKYTESYPGARSHQQSLVAHTAQMRGDLRGLHHWQITTILANPLLWGTGSHGKAVMNTWIPCVTVILLR